MMFLSSPGDPKPETTEVLGGMKDEIEIDYGIGAFICEFVAIGCKSYALKICLPDGTFTSTIKCKG